jgi:hypothetical protein
MKCFLEFVDRKQREAKKHLKLIEKVLRQSKLHVYSHLENDEPYLFVKANNKKLSFEGIRVYHIGDGIAYRVQKLEKTEPYGKAYSLDVEKMFNDYMSEDMDEKEAVTKVMEAVGEEIKKFFKKSAKAEEESRKGQGDGVGMIVKTGGSDYSSTVLNRL